MSSSLTILEQKRDTLLLAEIAAWLHMLGKLHKNFLCGDYDMDIKIPEEMENGFPELFRLFTINWTGNVWATLPYNQELRGKGVTISRLIKNHRESRPGLEGFIRLFTDAHGRGSGTEKGLLSRFAPDHINSVYLSTSLGYETPIKLEDVNKAYGSEPNSLYNFLQIKLDELERKKAKLSQKEWVDFRNEFIYCIENYYRRTVSETRRPLNDVTLYDQTAITVAFFKAALAETLLMGWKDPFVQEIEKKYHWRLLQVGLDGLEFWRNSTRVSDILARRKLVAKMLNAVQTLLEVTYPLGFEVFRDEKGSIFVVPDIGDLQKYSTGKKLLTEHIEEIAKDIFSKETRLFLPSVSDRTRNTLLFGIQIAGPIPQPAPKPTWLEEYWKDETGDICPVCSIRPQGPSEKALSRKVCNVCEERRLDRSKSWVQEILKIPPTEDEEVNRMESSIASSDIEARPKSIWIDEVADINGRLALIVAQFNMVDWLSGNAFNSVLSIDPSEHELIATERDESRNLSVVARYPFKLSSFVGIIEEGLRKDQKLLENGLSDFIFSEKDKVRGNTRGLITVKDVYEHFVRQTDLEIATTHPSPELLALALLRQSPTPARIYRVWRTTQKYWEGIVADFQYSVGEVNQRLRIRGKFTPDPIYRGGVGLYHTYDLRLHNVALSVTTIAEQEFLTVENLQRIAVLLNAPDEDCREYDKAVEFLDRQLQELLISGTQIEIEEPTGYGGPNKILGKLLITSVDRENISFIPAIPILTEPRTFMAVVPANRALSVAKTIKKKYEEEVGKVRNRLPLTMGIVFAGRRTPLPAILDAGRRMLQQPTADESWTVETVGLSSSSKEVELAMKRDEQFLSIKVSTVMGDNKTEDVWYPYWCVEEDSSGATPTGRQRQFKGMNGKEWVHICNLKEGDVVHLMPSRFDFEFLDTAARRFDISYDNAKRRGLFRPARPYYLEQLDDFEALWKALSDRLATSQIHNLISIIETKRMEWSAKGDDTTFQNIVRDALNNANWEPRPEQKIFEQLYGAALSGRLADVVELYFRILKSEPHTD